MTTRTLSIFRISNATSGLVFGEYSGETPEEAWAALCEDGVVAEEHSVPGADILFEEVEPRYTCRGSVRGSCGVTHRSLRTAAQCCERDRAYCRQAGGYSDRAIVVIEGDEERGLNEAEGNEVIAQPWRYR